MKSPGPLLLVFLVPLLGACTAAPVTDRSAQISGAEQSAPSHSEPSRAGISQSEPVADPQSGDDGAADDLGAQDSPEDQIDLAKITARYENKQPEQWGTDVDGVISSINSGSVVLTLDACGGPGGDGYDDVLIEGLIDRDVPATLFLNQRWIESHPDLTAELAANPLFEIANHGTEHVPLSVSGLSAYEIPGTASAPDVIDEVWGNHQTIEEITGQAPRYFRSGTAHYDEVSVAIVEELGERVAGFSVNGDGGATLSAAEVQAEVAAAQPGDIILAHMNQPAGDTAEGLLAGVDDLLEQGVTFSLLD